MREPSPNRRIGFVLDGGAVSASIDDEDLGSWSDWREARAALAALEASRNPLAIDRGDVLTVIGSGDPHPRVLSSVTVAPHLRAELDGLEERAQEAGKDDVDWRCSPYDVDIEVNRERWGWLPVNGEWWFLPVDFQSSATDLLTFILAWVGSMPGSTYEAGCRTTAACSMTWRWDDNDGLTSFGVEYGSPEPVDLVRSLLDEFLPEAEARCVDNAGSGWDETTVRFDAAPSVPLAVIGETLARFWVACNVHSPDWRIELADHSWSWGEGTWIPVDGG